jgi:lipid A ethanolaminephosphotransferase
MLKTKYPAIVFCSIIAIVYSILLLVPNYRHYPIANLTDVLLIFIHWGLSAMGIITVVCVLSLSKYLYLFIFPLFVLVSSVAAYFTWQMDVSINSALIESLLNTNAEEVVNYVSFSLIIFVLINLILAFISIYFRNRLSYTRRQFFVTLIVACACYMFFWLTNQIRAHTLLVRAPFSFYYAISDYIDGLSDSNQYRFLLGSSAAAKSDSIYVVFVIGESLRSDHLQMNGYHRTTMPLMESRNVVSLPNVFIPYTYTALCLPYILTRAQGEDLLPIQNESSFVSIFKRSGFGTSWLANQNPIKPVKYFMNECDTVFVNKPHFTDYSNLKKFDSDLIEPFRKSVNQSHINHLFILHMTGNHWWYNKNLPDDFVYYTPILDNKEISSSNKERMINSYDNVIRFTDYVMDQFISFVEDKASIVIFLSDHGQSFGEEGKWLHANDTAAEKNPACFIWVSSAYSRKFPEKHASLMLNRNNRIDASFLFHSIVDAADIVSDEIELTNSVFSSQFQKEKASID